MGKKVWEEFEVLTQEVYQAIINKEGSNNIQVRHNEKLIGKDGVPRQIDVFWELNLANVKHRVIINCKHYKSRVTIGDIDAIHSVAQDLEAKAIVVTSIGFQSGAETKARNCGIGLKIIRKPKDDDWNNRIKTIQLDIGATVPTNLTVSINLHPCSEEQCARLKIKIGDKHTFSNETKLSEKYFLNSSGIPYSESIEQYVNKNLTHKDVGIKKTVIIEPKDHYLIRTIDGSQEMLRVKEITATYTVWQYNSRSIFNAAEIVDYVMEDFLTKEIEHFHTRSLRHQAINPIS